MPERETLRTMIVELIKKLSGKKAEPEEVELLREMINAYRAFGGY